MTTQPQADEPRVLMAPMNLAMMPVLLVEELQRRGYKANHIQYTYGKPHRFGFRMDRAINLHDHGGRIRGMAHVLKDVLEEDFNIFHYWNKSLFYKGDYGQLSGFDIPLIKARGLKLCYRFSGFDIRLPSWDKEVNPHSPFHYGFEYPYDEGIVKAYHGLLREHVDQFIVQDPELGQFMPNSRVVPRGLELDVWKYVGPIRKTRPLVVHAPSNSIVKGTPFVLKAVEELKAEGLDFDFQLIQNTSLEQARAIYEKADIVIDQLLIGATGVLTLEGWALGKCVVTNLRPDLFNDFYKTTDLPRINATPTDVTDQLRLAIGDAALREDLGQRGRELVERFHPIEKVTDTLLEVYRDVLAAPPKRPTGYGDIDYLRVQTQLTQTAEAAAARAEKQAEAEQRQTAAEDAAAEAERAAQPLLRRVTSTLWNTSGAELYNDARERGGQLWETTTRNPLVSARFAQAVSDRTVVDPVDVIIGHDIWSLLAATKVRARDGAAVVADMVEIPILEHRSGLALRSIRKPVREQIDRAVKVQLVRADHVTTVSPSLVSYIGDYTDRPVQLLRNFREASELPADASLRERLRLSEEHRIIAFVNTMAPGYGAEETIQALASLDERFQLVTIGRFASVEFRAELAELAQSLGVDTRVHMLDPMEPRAFVQYLSGADVGVIAAAGDQLNLQMAFPNRVTDYITAGVPIVAHGMHDVDALVQDLGIGVVARTLSGADLADSLRQVASSEPTSAIRVALARAQKTHNWATESQSFVDYCDTIGRERMRARGGIKPHTVIAARKTIKSNGRIYRMAKSLSEAGHYVRVIAYDEFGPDYAGLENVSVMPVGKDVI